MSLSHLRFLLAFVACVAVLAAPSLALGAAQRTFVKSTGVDTLPGPVPNVCSVASPCRTFDAAMLQTLPGGEVIVLDSAGYGAVTISQSVSIIAPPGVYAGITASSGDGVTVNGAGIVVVLQGLTINGLGTGNNGINFIAGDELHVINGSISNFALTGITAGGRLFVSDTIIRGNFHLAWRRIPQYWSACAWRGRRASGHLQRSRPAMACRSTEALSRTTTAMACVVCLAQGTTCESR